MDISLLIAVKKVWDNFILLRIQFNLNRFFFFSNFESIALNKNYDRLCFPNKIFIIFLKN